MIERYFHLTCDYCGLREFLKTNKFPEGWKWSQVLLEPVKHICPECLEENQGDGRRWKDGGKL